MELFYKATNVNGGAKLMFGSQEVQKLMFQDKLVYEDSLPVGTMLINNLINLPYGDDKELTLDKASSNLTNIKSEMKITWGLNIWEYSTNFTTDDLRKGLILTGSDNNKYIYLTLIKNTNKLSSHVTANNIYIKKIELV